MSPPVWTVALLCLSVASAEIIDLSFSFDNMTHYWYPQDRFNLSSLRFDTVSDLYYQAFQFAAQEHGGTHMDAPSHFVAGGWTLEKIPPERFIAHAAVLDITRRADADRDALLNAGDVQAWKRRHGPFQYPTVVLMRTGYARRWHDRAAYFGAPADQPDQRHFPGIGVDAAHALAADAAVVGVGVDTASIDAGNVGMARGFPAHQVLGAKNLYNLECLADMSRLPENGAIIMAFPMKIAGGSGGPTRVLAQIPSG